MTCDLLPAGSPNNIDGRYYDIPGFARSADLLYIMMYPTPLSIFDALGH
jgi:hypothetical protein